MFALMHSFKKTWHTHKQIKQSLYFYIFIDPLSSTHSLTLSLSRLSYAYAGELVIPSGYYQNEPCSSSVYCIVPFFSLFHFSVACRSSFFVSFFLLNSMIGFFFFVYVQNFPKHSDSVLFVFSDVVDDWVGYFLLALETHYTMAG